MIRVRIEADCGEAAFHDVVREGREHPARAGDSGKQNPGCALKVVFPLDPDTFFVRDAPEGVEAETAEIAA